MDKNARLNKIKSCILDMNTAEDFDYREICKKHNVSAHVFTALKEKLSVRRIGPYKYKWATLPALAKLEETAQYCLEFAQEKIKKSQEKVAQRTPEQIAKVKERSEARKAAKEKAKLEANSEPITPSSISELSEPLPEPTRESAEVTQEPVKRFTEADVLKIHTDIVRFGITDVEEYIKTR